MNIKIINYNCGNPASIIRMIEKVGGTAQLINKPEELEKAEKIILPGVGAFDHGMKNLIDMGWKDPLNEAVLKKKVLVLGICLGMQLLCDSSEEGVLPGLGWIEAEVKKFKFNENSKLKIPHMGWNIVKPTKKSLLFDEGLDERRFYHVHSYRAVCKDINNITATASYGYEFATALEKDNILGVQFHPEKSHRFGMELMKKFMDIHVKA